MRIALNIILCVMAAVLFLGVLGERDEHRHTMITGSFIVTLAAIIVLNVCVSW